MKMQRLLIQLPTPLKHKLVALREQGTTTSGFIRWLLEQHFMKSTAGKKGR